MNARPAECVFGATLEDGLVYPQDLADHVVVKVADEVQVDIIRSA